MMFKTLSNRLAITLKTVIIGFIIVVSGCGQTPKIEWISPYKEVDWDNVIPAKAQFHAHTTVSDGWLAPHAVVDIYHELGYQVLAITDHWITTFPWSEFSSFEPSPGTLRRVESGDMDNMPREIILDYQNRDPEALGMVAVRGSEPSHTGAGKHHIVSLFSGVTGHEMGFKETLTAIEEAGGLVSFAHPARDTEWNNNTVDDYINYFDQYRQLYGIDVFTSYTISNQPERWSRAGQLIAEILMHYGSPADDNWRPVWMTSTDDMHRPHEYHSGFQIQLVENLDEENVYNSLRDGCFFWVAQPYGGQHPTIGSIDFGKTGITVNGNGYDQVSWYFNNEVIHTGETFDYFENGNDDLFYVYFVAYTSDFSVDEGTGSAIGSQPFWILTD